ncbi:MAG: hypothetical protein JST54_20310 [Deltaproteobacteria bacterium]|nr:hypothetical protein [Deltaproteobacteria bacterium]
MRWIIIHKTSAHWEAGAIPTKELVARVGEMIGGLQKKGALLGGEGLRPSSEGARLALARGMPTVTPGPFSNELPASFVILRMGSLDEAITWSRRYAVLAGDVQADIRPLTEAWDIGMAPKPPRLESRRWMVLFNATPATEAETPTAPDTRVAIERLLADTKAEGKLLTAETLRPTRGGARVHRAGGKIRTIDGPFAESKELVGGYVLVELPSREEALALAEHYADVVEAEEVELRLVADPT